MISAEEARKAIVHASVDACREINFFALEVLHTRGGRIGSGMGTLLEALWGYFVNGQLDASKSEISRCELAWMYGHEYNDFACIVKDAEWDPTRRTGELLRIETKSMVASADESKAHFDQLQAGIGQHDLLVIIVWDWVPVDKLRVCPQVVDHFVGPAIPIARLRDELHIARGGSFVTGNRCPDDCRDTNCEHVGEPLNEQGKRERLSGPSSRRVSQTVSYAANFGGMVRMLKTNSDRARAIFRSIRQDDDIAHAYISFIHRNFKAEEINQYTSDEWKRLASLLKIEKVPGNKRKLAEFIQDNYAHYQDQLRDLSKPIINGVQSEELVSMEIAGASRAADSSPVAHQYSSQGHQVLEPENLGDPQKLIKKIQSRLDPSKKEQEP